MTDQPVARVEAQLERLIEGAFAQLFGRGLTARDLAVRMTRALESGLLPSADADRRPIAPDHYAIRLHPDTADHLLIHQPGLVPVLAAHITTLAQAAGYRLLAEPLVELKPSAETPANAIVVVAGFQNEPQTATQTLDSQTLKAALERGPINPVLMINGEQTIPLTKPIITIGRGQDNDITISDRFVSRHHLQIRLRLGAYFAFDTNSQSGISINDAMVREHRLQSGDVIQIGKTRLLYLEDSQIGDGHTSTLPAAAG